MGVRGLTTFIARNAERYLEPHELHDTPLVIDGDNLCSQLYKRIDKGLSAFGGSYDDYFRAIVDFFGVLKKANVTPYVLLDGGYELKKLKTVRERLRSRIGSIKYIIPLDSYLVFPLMIREVFTSALKHCNVPVYRCLFEADNEIAILARKLDCPVLSYDSDFYIFDGKYIPFVTLSQKIYKKTISKKTVEVEIMSKKQKGQKYSKKKNQKVTIEVEDESVEEETYNYLDCCIYTIDNLTENTLDNDILPLFGIMLGNDFISRRWFNKFYRNVSKRNTKRKKHLSPQQKRIHTLLNWLQHETLLSAIKKILECVKHTQRHQLWRQIQAAMNGYRMEKSKSFEYFGFEEEGGEIEDEGGILSLTLEEIMALEIDEVESGSEEEGVAEEGDYEELSSENDEENEEIVKSDDENLKIEEEEYLPEPEDAEEADEIAVEIVQRKSFEFPQWFVELFSSGKTPRFFVDLLRSHRYINYPQVENFSGPDSNAISYPILYQIYSLLHSERVPRLYYYTRIPKHVRYEVKKFESDIFPQNEDFDFNQKKNLAYIRKVFERSFANAEEIFTMISQEVPDAHQLFFLAVIYWIKRSSSTNVIFLQTVIIAFIVHNIVDKKCEKIHRDGQQFVKKYEKYLKELKEKAREEEKDFSSSSIKTISKEITKNEAILCMENFVSHFSISPKFTRKHADFKREIVHTFSELQSVIFNLYALNSILQSPFENVKIENYFNGLFLYNMYWNLHSRANSMDYIKNCLFNHSTAFLTIFNKLYELCLDILPYLRKQAQKASLIVEKPPQPKKVKKPKKPKTVVAIEERVASSDEGEEFIDLNNKFSQLLRIHN